MLDAEPDLETVTPAATPREVAATRGVDVVVLVAGPELDPLELLGPSGARGSASSEGEGSRADAAARVVLVEDDALIPELVAAGADGCLVGSSTPLQICAAIRAAARGERADLEQLVTGPLVQRVHRVASSLSQREVEVLRLVGAGLGNQQIAERLYLSLSAVKSHLSHTYGRLGVARRDAAVAEARRQGLI